MEMSTSAVVGVSLLLCLLSQAVSTFRLLLSSSQHETSFAKSFHHAGFCAQSLAYIHSKELNVRKVRQYQKKIKRRMLQAAHEEQHTEELKPLEHHVRSCRAAVCQCANGCLYPYPEMIYPEKSCCQNQNCNAEAVKTTSPWTGMHCNACLAL